MEGPRSVASDDWHLVNGDSETDGSERSLYTQGSRPQTPAISFNGDLHELGSDCPPTPESERLADTVLCTPFAHSALSHTPSPREEGAPVDPRPQVCATSDPDECNSEVVGMHCLQGLSQEGSLEGFALQRLPTAKSSSPAPDSTWEAEDKEAHESDCASGWQGMDQHHLAALDGLSDWFESMGWGGSSMLGAWRATLAELRNELTEVGQSMAQGVAAAKEQARSAGTKLLTRITATTGTKPSLLVSALGITTLATLCGLIFFMGRCRTLTAQLQQRDKELARLVVKILNLQDALQQPRISGPVLRHTSLLSGLVAGSMM